MKKTMFIAFSAIGIVVACLLVVACSSDSNSPDVQVNKVVQRVAEDTSNEDAWTDFYAEVEALNARYAASTGNMSRIGVGAFDNIIMRPDPIAPDIAGRDIVGAIYGAEMGRSNSNGDNFSLRWTVIPAVWYSYMAFAAAQDDDSEYTISIRNIQTIGDLTNSHPCVALGKQHNQLLSVMLNANFDSSNMSNRQIIQAFINKYEQLFSVIPANVENQLLNMEAGRTPRMTINVQDANQRFRTATYSMTISTARSYTDDYLDVVNASQVDDYDKLQMCINAVMAYYSGALWVVQ